MRTSGGPWWHAMIMMQMGGIRGAYSEVMNGRLFVFIFMTNRWWLMTSFARLLRNRDIGPANLF